jgi:hypothetical protein
MSVRIVRAIRTCDACPSQWHAWTDDGRYLYLRYRSGIGTVEPQPGPDPDAWIDKDPIVEFGEPSRDGSITLADFCVAARLDLADDAEEAGVPTLYVLQTLPDLLDPLDGPHAA